MVTFDSDAPALRLQFAPNGVEVLALMQNEESFDIRLWNAETGATTEFIATGVAPSPLPAFSFSDDGKWLAWCEQLGDQATHSMEIKVWDRVAKEVRLRRALTADVYLRTIAFSPDGSLIAAIASPTKPTSVNGGTAVSALKFWAVATGRELHHFEESGAALCFLPDGNTLAVAGDSGTVNQSTYGGLDSFSTVFQPLSEGKLGERGWLKELLNLDAAEVMRLGFANSAVKSVDAYAHEANLVFVLSPNGTLLKGHKGHVQSLAFSLNGDLLATAGSDRSIRLWNTSDGSLRANLLGHLKPITCLAFSQRSGANG